MLHTIKVHSIVKSIVGGAQKNGRCFSTVRESVGGTIVRSDRECVEVQIPVPWGHLRGKWWGPTDKRPILGLHGWQDNCGTFDTLAPLLPPHIGFLTIDSPGHGWSSHYPPGFRYTIFDLPITVRRFAKEFQWQKVSLIGHSMGSIQSFLYSAIFDDQVDLYVGIDIMFPLMTDYKIEQANKYEKRIDQLLKYCDLAKKSDEPPSYTYEECIERSFIGSMESVSREYTPYILNRGIIPSKKEPNKFYFSRDPRVKVNNIPSFSEVECLNLAKTVKTPTFIIKATNSRFYSHTGYYLDILNKMKSSIQIFEHIEVPGTHHLHLLTPEVIVDSVNEFVLKYDKEDRSQKSNLIDEIFVKKYA